MADLKFNAAARADLIEIDNYGSEHFGQDVADEYSRGFKEVFALLRRHPKAGAAKPELGSGMRCVVHRKHRVFYRTAGETVVIVRILHHAREHRRALKGEI